MGFVAFQFVNVFLNLIFRQKIKQTSLPFDELISVLIPARNEEHNIGLILDDLKKMNSLKLEIIVYDDQSTDNTFAIVQKHANADKRIKLIQSNGLPKQWLGKNHACYQLGQQANGRYYLFVDADVRLHGNVISDAISHLEKHKLGLLSFFPIQIQKTLGEKLTVPIMNYILLTLLPLIFVRISPFSSHSAANGQFMLFNANHYKKHQPHKMFKTSPVEDIVISRFYKRQNIKIACITGDNRIKCRMYESYKGALNGFAKNVLMFFGNKPVLALLFGMFAVFGFIPLILLSSELLLLYFIVIIIIQILYSFISRQNSVINTLLFPLQLLFLFQVLITSILNKKFKQYSWKGRNIYS